ncbi:related to Mitochondrial inner membrane protein OXA1 [Saccharomycodes ludwigii]|uniref:Related to Mitochondrial inner membrane protein OXA1 n=1 Tax=Saccharomycodes ludwigii TaxID=36035 RepID=A0A376B7I3_9ASCO|nr:hypothetical protein SCDLUD_001636 [Saccharomycodes ludwigii]KAH3901853.1 hypothetical protein SCDLUD_001636 [Saccharomycodes ludwigii]SSD60628.1 related to Mitochondrial inner membrane protein OXA1 [Saccharomycodes ludwigii]
MFRSTLLRTSKQTLLFSTKIRTPTSFAHIKSAAFPLQSLKNNDYNLAIIPFKRFNSTSSSSSAITKETASEITTQLPSFSESVTDSIASAAASPVSGNLGDVITTVGEASSHIGYLSSIGMANNWYWPPDLLQHLMEYVHVYLGLPWWGTIVVTAITVRVLLFPLYVKSSDTTAKNSQIKPQLDKINKELFNSSDMIESQKIALKRKKLLQENGIKMRWLAAPMIQVPVAIGFFSGLRQMCNYPVDGFTNQGLAWFTDLSAADPYLGLQVITASVFIGFTRLGGETGAQQFSPQLKKVFTILPLLSIPATMNLGAGVVLYFAVNGFFSVLQSLVLRNEWCRKKLGISKIVIHNNTGGDADEKKSILQSFKDNINKAKEQAEKRAEMKNKEIEKQEKFKEKRASSQIKIIRRSDLKKK